MWICSWIFPAENKAQGGRRAQTDPRALVPLWRWDREWRSLSGESAPLGQGALSPGCACRELSAPVGAGLYRNLIQTRL